MRSNRSRFVLLLLAATALSLMTLDFRGFGPLENAQTALRGVLEPISGGVDSALSPLRNAWRGATNYDDLVRENDQLRLRVDKFESDPLRVGNAQQQLDELKAQLGITTAANVESRIARVISGSVSNFENNVRIDKGSAAGIRAEMVVVTDAGLVGRVVDVTTNQSVVALADSRDFGVGVRSASAAAPTNFVLRGQGAGRPLLVQGALEANTVTVGSALVTSGLDGSVFPADIVVGTVTKVPASIGSAADRGRLRGVEVELVVEPSSLSFVTVLLWPPS